MSVPLSIGIVGSGPSGMFAAKYLLRRYPSVHVDILDKLPVPFGLVRYGVAPDHQDTKNVANDFDRTLRMPGIRFMGRVHVGRDIALNVLRKCYSAIILAYGAEEDIKLGIEGENLRGVCGVRSLVNFYNGYPSSNQEMRDVEEILQRKDVKNVVIIGQGNVAIDASRILSSTGEYLKNSDIAEAASKVILNSAIKTIHLVGRRGPLQATFTTKELRELSSLKDRFCTVNEAEMKLGKNAESMIEYESDRVKRRKFDLLESIANLGNVNNEFKNRIDFRFLLAPIGFLPHPVYPDFVGSVVFERTKLVGPANSQKAEGTGEHVTIAADLVLRSIGFTPEKIEGVQIEKGHAVHEHGRMEYGLYVAGWLKRGPTGIIGTNIQDAIETVETLLEDNANGRLPTSSLCIDRVLEQGKITPISYDQWLQLDLRERELGKVNNKPREKITNFDKLL